MKSGNVLENNSLILRLLSEYINFMPDAINQQMIEEAKELCGVDTTEAFRILIAGILDIYDNKELRGGWLRNMFSLLDCEKYENDPYRRTIKLPDVRDGQWEFSTDRYKPYEAFVFNDLTEDSDGRILPQIGFFEREYTFPVVKQNGREWMLITPNEIETMKQPISDAFGRVVTYGLGLGYFAFMASEKENVSSVTVVERDMSVIRLFEKHILPQFPNKHKINIICDDAFAYAEERHPSDFVFADIWHDPSDGCSAYIKFKALEIPSVKYSYWIENTIKYYL